MTEKNGFPQTSCYMDIPDRILPSLQQTFWDDCCFTLLYWLHKLVWGFLDMHIACMGILSNTRLSPLCIPPSTYHYKFLYAFHRLCWFLLDSHKHLDKDNNEWSSLAKSLVPQVTEFLRNKMEFSKATYHAYVPSNSNSKANTATNAAVASAPLVTLSTKCSRMKLDQEVEVVMSDRTSTFNHPWLQLEGLNPWFTLIALASHKKARESRGKLNKDLSAQKQIVLAAFFRTSANSMDKIWNVDEIAIHDIDLGRGFSFKWLMQQNAKHFRRFIAISMMHESFHELRVILQAIDSMRGRDRNISEK